MSGNNKVWKKITFAPLTITKIRVLINTTADSWSRIVEVGAWSPNINWLVTDHLGTPRMVIDQTGTAGDEVWTGKEAARARIATLTKEELQRAGVTKEIAAQWRDFYREVARVTPANPSAAGRADLMQRAVELLSK